MCRSCLRSANPQRVRALVPALMFWFEGLWQPAFSAWGSPVTWAELLALVLSLWIVERNIRVSTLAWPLAIASAVLYYFVFRFSGLYGEAALQWMFVGISVWGWWQWRRGQQQQFGGLRVRALSNRGRWILGAATVTAWPLLGAWLAARTDSTVPYWDALATVGSIAGQWLLGRKHIENWPVWIVVNVFSVGLFAYKGLWLTALLYAVFAGLAVVGWRAWQRLAAAT